EAGPCHSGALVTSSANGGVIAKDRRESLDAVDPVLKCDHTSVGADEGARLLTRRLRVPELYGEQDDVDRSDPLGIIGDVDVLQMKVAQRAFDLEALLPNGFAIPSTPDEHHLVTVPRPPPPPQQ